MKKEDGELTTKKNAEDANKTKYKKDYDDAETARKATATKYGYDEKEYKGDKAPEMPKE